MNKGWKGAQRPFSTEDGKISLIYPDFISKKIENEIIADAKYKPIENIGNRDYLQAIAYMFRFDAEKEYYYYLYPDKHEEDDLQLKINQESTYQNNVIPREDIYSN